MQLHRLFLVLALATAACEGQPPAGSDGGSPPGTPDAGNQAGVDAEPGPPFEPVFFDDYEGQAAGTVLTAYGPYDAASRSVVTQERAHRGAQSARMEIRVGDGGGFGEWGAVVPLASPIPRGGEIWVRLYVYWPASFEFSAAPWMKFLRLHDRQADGSNGGYNDLYIDNADATTSVLRTIKEGHNVWDVYDGPSIARDRWERYEMYLFVDNVPVDSGGQARMRVWRDAQLIFDRTDVPTIGGADHVLNAFYLFTYWNNETPPNNHCYVDDLVIASDASPPPNVDAAGHRVIGDWAP